MQAERRSAGARTLWRVDAGEEELVGTPIDVGELIRRLSLSPVGQSANTAYYALDDDVLFGIPELGSKDTGPTAWDNRRAQVRYFRERGKKGGVVIFFDRMVSQDKDARRAYETMDCALTCCALVGGSMLTRAMFSFFLGVARPRVPIKLFGDAESAVRWIREVNQRADRTLAPDQDQP